VIRTVKTLIRFCFAAALGLVLMASSGCRTSKVDWNSRIGAYTFDQAVKDSGPPDRDAVLADGSRVSEWILQRGGSLSVISSPPSGPYYPHGGYVSGPVFVDNSPEYSIRLTFGPDRVLKAWKKVVK
jgi:hypothetical protein